MKFVFYRLLFIILLFACLNQSKIILSNNITKNNEKTLVKEKDGIKIKVEAEEVKKVEKKLEEAEEIKNENKEKKTEEKNEKIKVEKYKVSTFEIPEIKGRETLHGTNSVNTISSNSNQTNAFIKGKNENEMHHDVNYRHNINPNVISSGEYFSSPMRTVGQSVGVGIAPSRGYIPTLNIRRPIPITPPILNPRPIVGMIPSPMSNIIRSPSIVPSLEVLQRQSVINSDISFVHPGQPNPLIHSFSNSNADIRDPNMRLSSGVSTGLTAGAIPLDPLQRLSVIPPIMKGPVGRSPPLHESPFAVEANEVIPHQRFGTHFSNFASNINDGNISNLDENLDENEDNHEDFSENRQNNKNSQSEIDLIEELNHTKYLVIKRQYKRAEEGLIEIIQSLDNTNLNIFNDDKATAIKDINKIKNLDQSKLQEASKVVSLLNNLKDILIRNTKSNTVIKNKTGSLSEILKWAKLYGIMKDKVTPKKSKKIQNKIGFFANKEIQVKDEIISIPNKMLIYEENPLVKPTCEKVKQIKELLENYDKICLSVFLLQNLDNEKELRFLQKDNLNNLIKDKYDELDNENENELNTEKSKSKSSDESTNIFSKYASFSINETNYDIFPIFYNNSNHLDLLKDTYFLKLIEQRKELFKSEFELLKKIFLGFNLKKYIKARLTVLSKNFIINTKDLNVKKGKSLIAPITEFIVYDKEPNSKFKITKGNFTILASKNIKKGQEITINYGKMSNYHYLLYYGFTIKNNNKAISLNLQLDGQEIALNSEFDLNVTLNPIRKAILSGKNNLNRNLEIRALRKLSILTKNKVNKLNQAIRKYKQYSKNGLNIDDVIMPNIIRIIREERDLLNIYLTMSTLSADALYNKVVPDEINSNKYLKQYWDTINSEFKLSNSNEKVQIDEKPLAPKSDNLQTEELDSNAKVKNKSLRKFN